ncbi:hypothetical protein J2D73_19305 [Acetobacter sacchari]|uniref:DGQHR domain-containing protein n=1 Tax=Acetobacter sacchari TaxID=2661687 RepID=A0ABS3M1A6_9PROT|nr:DNA sulfur modification protein DndB [Acetobacter sacchari]MBO1361934.1 hypothetical protein [Acetobacter sacchari]
MPKKKPSTSASISKRTSTSGQNHREKSSKVAKAPSKTLGIFEAAGFQHIKSDNIHFLVSQQMGEIDYVFVWENVILLVEETTGEDLSKHPPKKIHFHKLIDQNKNDFFRSFSAACPEFGTYMSGDYQANEMEIRHVYYSECQLVPSGISFNPQPFKIMQPSDGAYFEKLTKDIQKSSKYELLKYLNVKLCDVGQSRISGSGVTSKSFAGFALPSKHTNYPDDFVVVTFYADPASLILRAYVLRRNGWEQPTLSYQRFVQSEKLTSMREYLSKNGKVFINNLIVTLPSNSIMQDADGQIISPSELTQKTSVKLILQDELASIGIVDGQHRILSYFEGVDAIDKEIKNIRQRQNLLVTGIIFPKDYDDERKMKFEAELFLSINNTQTSVNPELRQDLEAIINPSSPLGMGRTIIHKLAETGALSGLLHVNQSDSSNLISTGSLGPHVLQQLVRSTSPLYKEWAKSKSVDLSLEKDRDSFVDYCANELRSMLGAAAGIMEPKWKPVDIGGILSTAVVGGFMLLLNRLCKVHSYPRDYKKLLSPIKNFDFSKYTSSNWARMAREIMQKISPNEGS